MHPPLIIVSRPILTSDDEGPIRGTMIMGRYLDDAELARFAELTDLSLSVYRFSEPTSSSDLQTAKSFLSEQAPTFIQPLSEESIAGYTLLEDIYGKPALVLKVDTPRSIYGQGQATLRYLILSILAVALAFSVVIMLALNRLVLSPLSQLNDNVNDIGKSGDPSRRVSVTGRDEFANLAGAINETLASMEEFQNELLLVHPRLIPFRQNPIRFHKPDLEKSLVRSPLLPSHSSATTLQRVPWQVHLKQTNVKLARYICCNSPISSCSSLISSALLSAILLALLRLLPRPMPIRACVIRRY
jgi:HAMP domain-containing protein